MSIPNPRFAKKMTLAGQKRIADEEEAKAKLAAEELKRQKQLEKNWRSQSRKLADEAINQRQFLIVENVIFPQKLIDLEFEIVEIGDITRHYYGDLPREKIIDDLIKLIPKFSDKRPGGALRIWRYWEDIDKDLGREIEKFLNKTDSIYEPGAFMEHLNKNTKFRSLSLARFQPLFDEIQSAIEKVKIVMQASNWEWFAFDKSETLLKQACEGKYFFSKKDNFDDELKPAASGNIFQINWEHGVYTSINKPRNVICADGLAWLSESEGQRFCQSFGNRIELAASDGKSEITLSLEAGIVQDEDAFVGLCPNENFLTELVSLLGYTCKTQKDADQVTYFHIAW